MNGRKAKALRKQVYGNTPHTFRDRQYRFEHVTNMIIKDAQGNAHTIPLHTCHADSRRKLYQSLKKSN